jgi:regulator of sirC expression with transglutaminase-like and TPR domain
MLEDQFKAIDYIKESAGKADGEIDAGKLALALVYDDHTGLTPPSLERYFHHFKIIAQNVMQHYRMLLDAGSVDDVGVRMAALKSVIIGELGYEGDDPNYEALESADMIRVIDRGSGSRAALGIIYMDAARKCGWQVEGLDVASHFLCRIEHNGERQIFDPADGCKIMRAHNLRALVKDRLGEEAELSSEYMDGMNIRQCLIYLCNYLKSRRIEMGEYDQALKMIERMRMVEPDEYRLMLDAGVLYARTGQIDEARACLEDYIKIAPSPYDQYEARVLLNELNQI